LIDLYGADGARASAEAEARPTSSTISLQLVAFADCSDVQLAEFLRAIRAQKLPSIKLDVLVVTARAGRNESNPTDQARKAYAHLAAFVSPQELPGALGIENGGCNAPSRAFVVVSSCSCLPPPDWLAVLGACITTYPEVELFHGTCRPRAIEGAGLVERVGYDLGLFPHSADHGGVLYFAQVAGFACSKSLLVGSGGLAQDAMQAFGVWTLTERIMKAGGSSLHVSDWQTRFRVDSTLMQLLRRVYQDGRYGAMHVAVTKDRDVASRFFSTHGLRGSIAAAWRFAVDNFRVWRFADRPFLLHAPAFLLLLAAGLARQAGWRAGLRAFSANSIPDAG
jgi:hypothetical protein